VKVLIYGINFSPELTGIGKYTGEMAEWLSAAGYQVRVITAQPYYPAWRFSDGYKNRYTVSSEQGFKVIRCPMYVPAKPTGLKRMLHLMSFSLTSFFPVLGTVFWKPDLVVQVAPTLFCSLQTLLLAKMTKGKSVLHIQDFEVDAMVGLSMMRSNWVGNLAYWFEKNILQRFDVVSTISEGMMKRALDKGVRAERLVLFPNWSEVHRFLDVQSSPELLLSLDLDPNKKIILYSGNMGEKQGLESVLYVAQRMAADSELIFLLVGTGAGKARLEALSASLGLKNVFFLPLQPYEELPQLLALAHCHLVVQRAGAADAVLPSKLTNILAVGGNSVITAFAGTSLGDLCEDHKGISVLVDPDSVSALEAGIVQALAMPRPNAVAREYAQTYLDQDLILKQFLKNLTKALH